MKYGAWHSGSSWFWLDAVQQSTSKTTGTVKSKTGTEHFVLKQGALVRLLDSRPGWHQIARYDGRRSRPAARGGQRPAKRLIGKIRNSLVDYTDNPQ